MHITAFTTTQAHHVAQVVYKYWLNSCTMIPTQSLQVVSNFHASQTKSFCNYVSKLVCPDLVHILLVLINSLAEDASHLGINQRIQTWSFFFQH